MNYRSRSIGAYLILTFLVSWSSWGIMAVFQLEPGVTVGGLLWLVGGFGPAIGAIIVAGTFSEGESAQTLLRRLLHIRVGWRWYGVALLFPGFVVTLAVTVDALVFDVPFPKIELSFIVILAALIVASSIIGGGLEEIGWRGFLLAYLQGQYSALSASIIVGLIWMVWHAPLFIVPGAVQTDLSIIPYVLQGVALAVILTWIYNSTRGSLLLVVLLHGAFNAWLSSLWILREDVSNQTVWVMATIVCAVALFIISRYGWVDLAEVERQSV